MKTNHEKSESALKRSGSGDAQTKPPAFSGPAGERPCVAPPGCSLAEIFPVTEVDSLAELEVSGDFLAKIPISFARYHNVLGLRGDDCEMMLAFCEYASWPQLETISKVLDRPFRPVLAPRDEIKRAINAAYQQQTHQARNVIEQLNSDEVMEKLSQVASEGGEDLLDVASRAPVIKLVNLMLFEAVKYRASDVHIQPYENKLVVRYRVDGVLFDIHEPPKPLQEEILSRIKVMGAMNIAERQLPQDGRATVEVGGRYVDLRISSLPTCFGERIVIRLLDKSSHLYTLEELGMPSDVLQGYRDIIKNDHGIVLVTGPTGSGKSTTLYAALQEINSDALNVLTLEDPIEYRLEGISQTQINEKKGMTFAAGLRNVLRQDPDIVMVGEIRDAETARMAIQAALTGHLVFSTLHTNDAAGAVARLLDLGVEPYLVASSLYGVLAQRLVRQICPQCKSPYQPSTSELSRLARVNPESGANLGDFKGESEIFRGSGCSECMNTGYHGRRGIFELLTVNEDVRDLITHRAKASNIKSAAMAGGMSTLRQHGLMKIAQGETTVEEVLRVTGRDES